MKELNRDWFLAANMEELLDEALENDIGVETFKMLCLFKIAQYLEKIVYNKTTKIPDPFAESYLAQTLEKLRKENEGEKRPK